MNEILAHTDGYRTVAIEQTFDHTAKHPKSSDLIPAPVDLAAYASPLAGRMTLLNRLTIVYQDAVVVHTMNTSANLKRYHLVAGAPKTEAAMQHCCSTFGGDIVARCETESGAGYRMLHISHKYYQLALRRGLCFELKYAPAIVDSNVRRDILTIGYQYASQRKAKNVVISSGAEGRFQVRGPYDIANLGLIFGLSEEQSKSAISHTCRRVLLRAESRRLGKTVMYVRNVVGAGNDSDEADDVVDDEEEEEDEGDFDGYAEVQPCKKQKIK